jgi:hypothetical protein
MCGLYLENVERRKGIHHVSIQTQVCGLDLNFLQQHARIPQRADNKQIAFKNIRMNNKFLDNHEGRLKRKDGRCYRIDATYHNRAFQLDRSWAPGGWCSKFRDIWCARRHAGAEPTPRPAVRRWGVAHTPSGQAKIHKPPRFFRWPPERDLKQRDRPQQRILIRVQRRHPRATTMAPERPFPAKNLSSRGSLRRPTEKHQHSFKWTTTSNRTGTHPSNFNVHVCENYDLQSRHRYRKPCSGP